MKQIIALELRKQRSLFLSLLIVVALGFAGAVLFLVLRSTLALNEALTGAGVLCALITPFLAVFLGTSAAGGLRNSLGKSIEETLPAHPAKKVFGACLAGLFYLSLLSLL